MEIILGFEKLSVASFYEDVGTGIFNGFYVGKGKGGVQISKIVMQIYAKFLAIYLHHFLLKCLMGWRGS